MRAVKILGLISLLLVVATVLTGLSSCGSRNNQSQSATDVNEAIRKEIEEYAYPLPSAFEAANMLNEIEANYLDEIPNDPKKTEIYFTEKSKALNLGIYTADLAYATTYDKKQEIQRYFEACETLVRELDFAAAFSSDLAGRIESNFDNKDHLVEIITEMFQDAYSYLNQQGRAELSYLVLSGTILEGLYLTMHISENTFQNPKIIAAILFQKEPLLNLQKMMESNCESELIKGVYRDIQQINEIYAQEPGNTSMSESQIIQLGKILTTIRNGYVDNQ